MSHRTLRPASSRPTVLVHAMPCGGAGDADLLAGFEALREEPLPWLLDSALRDGRLGRFSFAGAAPHRVLRARGRDLHVEEHRPIAGFAEAEVGHFEADPLEALAAMTAPAEVQLVGTGAERAQALPFLGGAVGYLGYELVNQIEGPICSQGDDLGCPDLVLLCVDRLVALDHERGEALALGLGYDADPSRARADAEAAARAMAQRWASGRARPDGRERAGPAQAEGLAMRRGMLSQAIPEQLVRAFDAAGYREQVEAIREEIIAGNVYEANFTQRMTVPFEGDAWSVYRALRATNPAPFAAYLELPEGRLLGSSPERFLRVDGFGGVESRPIKGTRPRGLDAAADARLRRELADSPKDRAENLMIVDLVRNDLGRVCEVGSVHVPELMAIESYASVFQMVSTIRGRLRADRDVADLLRASFPPGSMTGAPKIAAMKLLDRLEPTRRGVYSGALGYFDVRGGLDLSVVIRTLLIGKEHAHLHVGGAVVADSVGAEEYEESLHKARALLSALEKG